MDGGLNDRNPSSPLVADGGEVVDNRPTLPPPNSDPARILALSGTVTQRYHRDTITALIESLQPNALIATQPAPGSVKPALARSIKQPILETGRGMKPDVVSMCDGEIVVAAAGGGGDSLTPGIVNGQLPDDTDTNHQTPLQAASQRSLITDDISLSVDPYQRCTTLDGIETYCERLSADWLVGDTVHLSTALRTGFQTTTDEHTIGGSMTVVGIGESSAKLGVGSEKTDVTAALIDIYSNGALDTKEVNPENFGLRGVNQVGQTRAKTLRDAGITTPQNLVDARLSELGDLDGIAEATAKKIQTAAKARVTGTVVPTGDGSLPGGQPVFLDIETDGFNPSTAWLIGVLDGDAETGEYLAFREAKPGDGTHLEAFMNWLTGSAAGRPVVAWHGYEFDFPVIEDQLRQHCPEYLDDWHDTYCFDALYWARDKNGGNAALPGRTNKQEAVAGALGWESSTKGIDGGTVAETYVDWRNQLERAENPATVPTPDWERLEDYCEDDVRALATIYDALSEAARRSPETSSPTGEHSTQGSLSDFS